MPSLATAHNYSAPLFLPVPPAQYLSLHRASTNWSIHCRLRPIFQSTWKHKVDINVLGKYLIQDMFASLQIGILIPLLLYLGSFWTKCTEEALRIIQDIILLLNKDNVWKFAPNVPGEFTATSAHRYLSTQHDVFKDLIELSQGI